MPKDKKTFYITFGQKSPFRNGWVECKASSKLMASDEAHNVFGPHWSMLYETEPSLEDFPSGRIGEMMEGY